MPCPISPCGIVKVILPSGSMRTNAFGAKSAFGSAASAALSREMETLRNRPPPTAVVAFSIVRRVSMREDEDAVIGEPPSSRTRGLLDRGANAHVRATPADVSSHCGVDVGILRVGSAGEQSGGGHDLAGLAIAALRVLEVEPRLLDLASRLRCIDSFNGCDLSVADRADRQQTRADRIAIDLHRARAALCDAAAELRARHAQNIAQHPKERRVAFDIDCAIDAIDRDRAGHNSLHPIRVTYSQGSPRDAVLPQTQWRISDDRLLRYVRSLGTGRDTISTT